MSVSVRTAEEVPKTKEPGKSKKSRGGCEHTKHNLEEYTEIHFEPKTIESERCSTYQSHKRRTVMYD